MTEETLFAEIDKALEDARDDAFAFGAGWLIVDQNGLVRRVSPPDVVSWAARQMEKRK